MRKRLISFLFLILMILALHGCGNAKIEVSEETTIETTVAETVPLTEYAAFTDGIKLSWEELQDPVNGEKYGYNADMISYTEIGDQAFCLLVETTDEKGRAKTEHIGCASLCEIVIPDTVTTIGDSAFEQCSGLTEIILPDSITSLGSNAFMRCINLTHIQLSTNLSILPEEDFSGCLNLTTIEIPENISSIGDSAFSTCVSLQKIHIPDSVVSFGVNIFDNCTGLTDVTLPENLECIPVGMFMCCQSLEEINLPDTLKKIDSSAFSDCLSLTNISFPKTLTYIENKAFLNCPIGELDLPDHLEKIGENAFQGNQSISSLVLPESLALLGTGSFADCPALTSVSGHAMYNFNRYLPEQHYWVLRIFDNCTNLQYIDLNICDRYPYNIKYFTNNKNTEFLVSNEHVEDGDCPYCLNHNSTEIIRGLKVVWKNIHDIEFRSIHLFLVEECPQELLDSCTALYFQDPLPSDAVSWAGAIARDPECTVYIRVHIEYYLRDYSSGEQFIPTIIHELSHCLDFCTYDSYSETWKELFSEYGQTLADTYYGSYFDSFYYEQKLREAFAMGVESYFTDPVWLKTNCPPVYDYFSDFTFTYPEKEDEVIVEEEVEP